LPEWTVFDLRVLPVEALADHRAVVLRGVPSWSRPGRLSQHPRPPVSTGRPCGAGCVGEDCTPA